MPIERGCGFSSARRVCALGAVAMLLVAASTARAAGPSAARPALAALTADLRSGEPIRIARALDVLVEHAEPGATQALGELLHQGQPDALADRAIQALGATRSLEALPVLAEMTHHRRASARAAAYTAIGRIAGEAADELLAQGLRDVDAGVRGVCARLLGERGARAQLEPLFRALERGVPEAGPALGKLVDAAGVARFGAQLGRTPIQVMLGGYEQMLVRDDLTEQVKLGIVAQLGEVAGVTVKRFLEHMQADRDWSKQPRLQRSLVDTARRIDERPRPPAPEPRARQR